ncbi:Rid family detoxifying hydrolase [Methanoregula sp.]|jgi:2-iminobutanoate/2-iminopropanoate deaminase|uniref:Rid family detoxifying hydrolase n=1 Tax=Methanoregula sp. TaxID=2052170 RepID=UPI0035692AFA
MTVDKNSVIIVLVFVCGIVSGAVLAGLLLPQPVHPAKQAVVTKNAPTPIGPYNQAVQSGNFVFLSGQIGINPATGNLTGSSVDGQTTQAMKNIEAVLDASGLGFGDVVQTRIYFTNMSDWATINRIYASCFNDTYPARSAVQVAGLPAGAKVEIEMIAQKR